MLANGHVRTASSSFSSSGSGSAVGTAPRPNGTGASGRDSELRSALQASLQSLVQLKDVQNKLQRKLDDQASSHRQEVGALQLKVKELEADVESMQRIKQKNVELEDRLAKVEQRLTKLDELGDLVNRLEALETVSARREAVHISPSTPQAIRAITSPADNRSKALLQNGHAPTLHTATLVDQSPDSQSMSRTSSGSSGKRVSFAGSGDPVLQGGHDLLGSLAVRGKASPKMPGGLPDIVSQDDGDTFGIAGLANGISAPEPRLASPTSSKTTRSAEFGASRTDSLRATKAPVIGQAAPNQRGDDKLFAELEDLRRFKHDAQAQQRQLEAELATARARSQPATSEELVQREDAIRAKETVLKAEEARLQALDADLQEREAECADHERELEERLRQVQKRELAADTTEGIREMKTRLPTNEAREAAQFRKLQDLKALKEEYSRRLDALNRAEEDWCRKRGEHYVPVIETPKGLARQSKRDADQVHEASHTNQNGRITTRGSG